MNKDALERLAPKAPTVGTEFASYINSRRNNSILLLIILGRGGRKGEKDQITG